MAPGAGAGVGAGVEAGAASGEDGAAGSLAGEAGLGFGLGAAPRSRRPAGADLGRNCADHRAHARCAARVGLAIERGEDLGFLIGGEERAEGAARSWPVASPR